jgi:DNA-binding CsgD family transcriptional regulator
LRYVEEIPVSIDRDRLIYWLWKAVGLDAAPPPAASPFGAMVRGDWADAAAAWHERGCPYEYGLALLDGDAVAAQSALNVFLDLGAAPAADWARQRLRQLGMTRAPRGRRPSTRAHPAGLTRREVEVLEKLAEGLSNPDIARRLFVSAKTVDHHVSAILAKLDAPSRAAAVAHARQRGWLPRA